MNRKWIAVTVAALLLVLTSAGVAAAKYGKHRGGGGFGMFGFGGERAIAEMEVRLKLTPEQSQKVREMVSSQREKMFSEFQARRENHQALVREIFKDNPNQAEIQKRVAAIKQQQAATIDQLVASGLQLNQVLTSEQRTELNQVFDEREAVRDRMRSRMQERMQKRQAPQQD